MGLKSILQASDPSTEKKDSSDGKKPSGGGQKGEEPPPPPNMWDILKNSWPILGGVLLLTYLMGAPDGESGAEISFNDFRNQFLKNHNVEKLVVVNSSIVRVHLLHPIQVASAPGKPPRSVNVLFFKIGSVESFEKKLEAAQVPLTTRFSPSLSNH